jgi:hypothetical protein
MYSLKDILNGAEYILVKKRGVCRIYKFSIGFMNSEFVINVFITWNSSYP